uniref:Alanine racemase n=1 Tax=Roseihalotalea indica TaxID=2867963 RepID=A0AA49GRB7_9BACT|nr:bifunctional UDP-N-acetylmuramoyl-tripeptide:D-alanyl-D-alanine ligase/alanine racemase [Tunicatimonas sp. TK19036]
MITFSKIANLVGGNPLQLCQPQLPIQYLLTDSRSGIQNEASLFFAIQGERHNGHEYIDALYAQGVRQFVLEKPHHQGLPDANILLVDNSVQALQQIVAYHRQQFTIPVVGITGSNGKTIVKEWLSQLLSASESVVRNPKSYNSQIGVPLSVWAMNDSHTLGVFEAGISQVGEMNNLVQVLQPTIGIFTNIGSAHDEGFENREEKIREKARLFSASSSIIYRKDYEQVDQVLNEVYSSDRLYTWSTKSDAQATCFVIWNKKVEGTEITLQPRDRKPIVIKVPFQDEASLENISHSLVFGISQRYAIEMWQIALLQLKPVSMRMELKQGINQCYLVDDSYSNDLVSLQMGLDFLKQQSQSEHYTVILSDVLQSGQSDDVLYQNVAALLVEKGVRRLIGIGPKMLEQKKLFQTCSFQTQLFENTLAFLEQFRPDHFRNESILVKGARTFHFEQIVQRLQQKIHSTVLEINLDALTHNLNVYRGKLAPDTKMMVMVKAFSYGGASFEIANLLQFHQVDYLGVAYADEGVMLREHGIRTPVLVLNPSPDTFVKMADYRLEPEIYSLRMLHLFIDSLGGRVNQVPIHLKLDTGMHRLGFSPDELTELSQLLQQHSLKVASIFSHLAASDEHQHDAFTLQQIQLYKQGYKQLTQVLGYQPIRHILNSAGIIRFPEYQWDMVRLGIGLYGVEPAGQESVLLQPVSTLKTVISQIKYLKKGETVGYGRRGAVLQDSTTATIAIGYADGFDRGFGNGRAKVWVNGQWAPTIGSICMDMTMIDITGIEVAEGDEVIVFGAPISVTSLAQQIDTIPYEILTNIGERVKRVFFRES